MTRGTAILMSLFLLLTVPLNAKEDRATAVRNDKKTVEGGGEWIYEDLEKGIAEARKTGKPLLVLFR